MNKQDKIKGSNGNISTEYLKDENGCVNCVNCIDCIDCINCKDCINCEACINCEDCRECKICIDCEECDSCISCINCANLEDGNGYMNCEVLDDDENITKRTVYEEWTEVWDENHLNYMSDNNLDMESENINCDFIKNYAVNPELKVQLIDKDEDIKVESKDETAKESGEGKEEKGNFEPAQIWSVDKDEEWNYNSAQVWSEGKDEKWNYNSQQVWNDGIEGKWNYEPAQIWSEDKEEWNYNLEQESSEYKEEKWNSKPAQVWSDYKDEKWNYKPVQVWNDDKEEEWNYNSQQECSVNKEDKWNYNSPQEWNDDEDIEWDMGEEGRNWDIGEELSNKSYKETVETNDLEILFNFGHSDHQKDENRTGSSETARIVRRIDDLGRVVIPKEINKHSNCNYYEVTIGEEKYNLKEENRSFEEDKLFDVKYEFLDNEGLYDNKANYYDGFNTEDYYEVKNFEIESFEFSKNHKEAVEEVLKDNLWENKEFIRVKEKNKKIEKDMDKNSIWEGGDFYWDRP